MKSEKVDKKIYYSDLQSNYFKFGYLYFFKPFKGYERFIIAIPLPETDNEIFGYCLVTDVHGKKIDMLPGGIMPVSADICESKKKLPPATESKIKNLKY